MSQKLDGYAIERIIVQYLKQKGWRVLEQNFKIKFGEIDIIAQDTDKTLVAVEVKSMKKSEHFKPEYHFNHQKVHKIQKVFQHYITEHDFHNADCRIDLVAVEVDITTQKTSVRHYKNVGV